MQPCEAALLHRINAWLCIDFVEAIAARLPDQGPRVTIDAVEAPHTANRAFEILMNITFNGKIWFWKGPAPWYFVTIPAQQCHELRAISGLVTYGWGMIPVSVRIGETEWKTSLFPKDDRYIVPIKASVRKAEQLETGDNVTIRLEVR